MTARHILWFGAAYIALVALAVWFNLGVLCLGDAKYDQGCGGFGVYIPLWEIFLLPLPIAAIILAQWRKSVPPPTIRLFAYLAVANVAARTSARSASCSVLRGARRSKPR